VVSANACQAVIAPIGAVGDQVSDLRAGDRVFGMARFPREGATQAADAHRAIEAGHTQGKIVLRA
jgi:NADPH:quinone reductase-like Zn-dependent oxidoreductase